MLILIFDSCRNLVIQNVNQIAGHDSVSMVIRKALQRGMAVPQLRRNSGSGNGSSHKDQLIQEIKELGNIALSENEMKDMTKYFSDDSARIQYILSNKEEFDEVVEFCTRIEKFITSPLKIQAPEDIAKKVTSA